MANEITVSAKLNVTKGSLSDSRSLSGSFTLAADPPLKIGGIASIGTSSHEALPMGDLTTAGWCYFKNLDGTNYVQIGTDVSSSFVPFLKLKAGEPAGPLRLGTNAPYAKANGANVALQYEIYED